MRGTILEVLSSFDVIRHLQTTAMLQLEYHAQILESDRGLQANG